MNGRRLHMLGAAFVLFLVALTTLSVVALTQSGSASDTATRADARAAKLVHDIAVNTYVRAVAGCKSARELRALLDDVDLELGFATNPSPRAQRVHERIHAYTDSNPNCDDLPPKP